MYAEQCVCLLKNARHAEKQIIFFLLIDRCIKGQKNVKGICHAGVVKKVTYQHRSKHMLG